MPRAWYSLLHFVMAPRLPISYDAQASRITVFLIFLLFRIDFATSANSSAPNSVVGDPYVNCAADAVYVKFKTQTTFKGHVNVKFTPNKYCYQVLVTNNQIEVLVPHEECAVSRRRSFQPAGVIMETSVSVSFHPEFTTKDDRLFHFNCFHQQKKKGLGLEVGSATMPPPEITPGPQCSYSILNDMGGRPVGTVTMGQIVYHEWKCTQTKDTCLIVRNCALVGGDTKHQLIGPDACSRDTKILPNLEYKNETYVSQRVAVFGVSSTPLVYFECELLLAPAANTNNCQQPQCEPEFNRTTRSLEMVSDAVMEVRSQRIEISELESTEHWKEMVDDPALSPSCNAQNLDDPGSLCLPISAFAITVAIIFSIAVFVIFLASLAMLQRYKYYSVTNSATS